MSIYKNKEKEIIDWENNQDLIYLMYIIMKYFKKDIVKYTAKELSQWANQCANIMSFIVGEKIKGSQVEFQIYSNLSNNKCSLRNLQIAIEVGYMDKDEFEKYVINSSIIK